jgi:hypothetical protein
VALGLFLAHPRDLGRLWQGLHPDRDGDPHHQMGAPEKDEDRE